MVLREVKRKLDLSVNAPLNGGEAGGTPSNPKAISDLRMWLERAERIRTQQRHDKNKLYALHAPEVECIGKGKADKPYEFGVKVSLAVTHKQGLMVGARSFTGNPFDGHILAAQLEQTTILLQDLQRSAKQVIVDLGFRGVDADNPGVQIIHRGKYKGAHHRAKALAQTAPSHRADDWAREVRQPHGSVLAAGCAGRRAARAELRAGLQHPLADAGDCSSGHRGGFFAPVFGCSHGAHGPAIQRQIVLCLPTGGMGSLRRRPADLIGACSGLRGGLI